MCLLAVLGSKGIVVKCTAAIFFRVVDCKHFKMQHVSKDRPTNIIPLTHHFVPD